MSRPILVMLCGLPGSGKSTFAKKYISMHPGTIHLSSDAIRKELWGDEAVQGDNSQVFTLMQSRAVEALNDGKSVVYDATNITRKDRAGIIASCPKFAQIDVYIIWAPIAMCIERDANRERTVGREVIDRMVKRFQAIWFDEGVDNIYVELPRECDQAWYVRHVMNSMKIPHDNPNHTLGIAEHCEAAAEYIRSKTTFAFTDIEIAASCHDIAKPYVKAFFDSKGNPSDVAHYYQHQCVGAYISYGLGVSLYVSWLVSTHMDIFLNTKYYRNLPAFMKRDLELLHEADVNAH